MDMFHKYRYLYKPEPIDIETPIKIEIVSEERFRPSSLPKKDFSKYLYFHCVISNFDLTCLRPKMLLTLTKR